MQQCGYAIGLVYEHTWAEQEDHVLEIAGSSLIDGSV
jgi:hypothetical protein